jgi:alpha-glucuronidase
LAQLEYQEGQSEVWRDAVVSWFENASGIPGPKPTISRPPGTGIVSESRDRIEAESMKLDGYEVKPVIPWESASGGKAVSCPIARCVATFQNEGGSGWYTIGIRYFDLPSGVAHFRVWVANQLVDEWDADGRFPARKLDGSSSNRRLIHGIALRPGDEIRIEGTPDRGDAAALDYVEIIFP